MAGTLTKDDFTGLEKRFVTDERFSGAVGVLKDRTEGNTDAIHSLERRIEQWEENIIAAIDRAMRDVAGRAELDNLKTRVGRLEQKVG